MIEHNRQTLEKGYILHGANYGYEIQKILGQGTFGITYLAKVKMEGALGTLDSNVMVAVKEFFMKEINGREGSSVTSGSNNGIFYDYRKKFKKEAENLSKLNHPNIVKVMESFEANNTIYYVMEYFPGGSLDQRIDKKGLPFDEVMKYSNQIGSALVFMHENKMLHLDLKPGNVVLDKDQNAILIDFGLSKQYDENGQPESSTTVGGGTPGYAPLEQANYHDGKDFPITMDVYALGATMYKMFVGERAPVASEILNDGFPTHTLSAKCSSKEMVACVEKAMAPLKKERYQSVNELLKAVSLCTENKFNQRAAEETIVCEVPILNDDGDWGCYDTIEGENEYGTAKIVKHKVTSHIPIPDRIIIKKEDSKAGRTYNVKLYKNANNEGFINAIEFKGERKQKEIKGGIPNDVMDYLKTNGFFSPVHWERESSTTRLGIEDPTHIIFKYNDGSQFVRHVSCPNHMVLRRAVEGILFNTSLSQIISQLSFKDDFEPDDILRREETIYGGPPAEEQQENTEEKDQKEDGCIVYILLFLAMAMHCLYPAMWCLTFLSDNISYPNLWSVGIAWLFGIILGFIVIGEGKDKEWLQNLGLWALLLIETAIVYYVNYIL